MARRRVRWTRLPQGPASLDEYSEGSLGRGLRQAGRRLPAAQPGRIRACLCVETAHSGRQPEMPAAGLCGGPRPAVRDRCTRSPRSGRRRRIVGRDPVPAWPAGRPRARRKRWRDASAESRPGSAADGPLSASIVPDVFRGGHARAGPLLHRPGWRDVVARQRGFDLRRWYGRRWRRALRRPRTGQHFARRFRGWRPARPAGQRLGRERLGLRQPRLLLRQRVGRRTAARPPSASMASPRWARLTSGPTAFRPACRR